MKKRSPNSGPDLTPELKARLEEEIAAFNKSQALDEIEREAIGAQDQSPYWQWVHSINNNLEPTNANPDLLLEEEAVNLTRPTLPSEIANAKREIDEILSFRERQVWRMVMRMGLSRKKTASLLHVGVGSVETYLRRAQAKVKKHFKEMPRVRKD